MNEGTRMKSLKEIMDGARKEAVESAGRTIRKLHDEAAQLGMEETAARLDKIGERLASDTFQIVVVGRFNNGKSTLLNALLGTAPGSAGGGRRGPLPTDMNPCTAVLASICYSEKPYVRAWGYDGTYEEWSWQQFVDESVIEYDEDANEERFRDVRTFELGFPAELCRSGVTLIDSPGTDDMLHRTAITKEAVQRADAAIVLYRSDAMAGQTEREFVSQELLDTNTRIFTVINRFHGTEIGNRLKGFVWERLVRSLRNGPKYDGQDFTDQDIYFVNALQAEEGRFNGDEEVVEESGLALLENRLGEFLLSDRHHIHLEKFTTAATREGAAIEKHVAQKRAILKRESSDLEQASEEIRPRLEEVRRRRDQVPEIFGRYRREAVKELDLGFMAMFGELRRQAPHRLRETPLASLAGWKGKLRGYAHKKKVVEEAAETFRAIVNEEITGWLDARQGEPGARHLLAPILERMKGEISERVGTIERSFEDIRLYLTGWERDANAVDADVSMTQRVLGVIAGFLVQDMGIAIAGGAAGWRGAVASFGGSFAAGVGLGLLMLAGIPISGPIFFGATLLSGIAGGIVGENVGLEARVKERVVEELEPRLDVVAEEVRKKLENQVSLLFNKMEDEGMTELVSAIEAEEQDVRSMLEANAQTREEKAKMLKDLEVIGHAVQDDLRILRQVGVEIAQVA